MNRNINLREDAAELLKTLNKKQDDKMRELIIKVHIEDLLGRMSIACAKEIMYEFADNKDINMGSIKSICKRAKI